MKKVEYSNLVKVKLLKLKKLLADEYGDNKAKEILISMVNCVDYLDVRKNL